MIVLAQLVADMHARRTLRLRVRSWSWLTRTEVPWTQAFGFYQEQSELIVEEALAANQARVQFARESVT